MKKLLLALMAFLLFSPLCYAGDVSVKGYTRKDGTYVAPYHRSSPDNTVTNNYDYKGNINPYTGQEGHNYYRSNPSSEYYGSTSSQYQQRSSSYNVNSNSQYGHDASAYIQPQSQYQDNTGQTQTIYSNGQTYKVTPQSDGSLVVKDAYGNAYKSNE